MPIYEYRRPDGSTFEVMQSFAEDPLTHDPETGVEVRRVLHAPAVHFKGKGFYNTDYGTRKRQRESAASADGAASGSDGEGSGTESSGKDGSGSVKEGGSSDGKGAAGESKPRGETSSAKGAKSKPVAATS